MREYFQVMNTNELFLPKLLCSNNNETKKSWWKTGIGICDILPEWNICAFTIRLDQNILFLMTDRHEKLVSNSFWTDHLHFNIIRSGKQIRFSLYLSDYLYYNFCILDSAKWSTMGFL